jgi:hypothetical protein
LQQPAALSAAPASMPPPRRNLLFDQACSSGNLTAPFSSLVSEMSLYINLSTLILPFSFPKQWHL